MQPSINKQYDTVLNFLWKKGQIEKKNEKKHACTGQSTQANLHK